MPKISVISACYNHGKYIHEMIDSVLAQTFQDFEIIIVNDGSTDDTLDILDNIGNDKVKIIHSEHSGPSHARNLAIELAEANIILNLDADDKIAPDLLGKAYKVFLQNPDAGIVYARCRYFGARRGESKVKPYSLEKMLHENRIEPTAFFRKEDWKNAGGYSEQFIYDLEDWDFWLKIIELHRKVFKIEDSYVYYRKYSRMSDCRSGRRKSDRGFYYHSLNLIFIRHKKLYSLYPEIYTKFSRYGKMPSGEKWIIKIFRNTGFHLKQKAGYLFR